MNLSIIITAKNESRTVGPLVSALEAELQAGDYQAEILLVCPDEETMQAGLENDRLNLLTWVKDRAKGKPAALNQAFAAAKGDILVLTDGDVVWVEGALKELIFRLDCRGRSRPAPTKNIGLVTGHPVPLNKKDNLLGFWAHFLTFAADSQRKKSRQDGKYFDASGYLLAIRNKLVAPIPADILVDDAYLSHLVWNKGKKINYAWKAKVKVKFPTSFSDWLKQKKRTLSGYVQLREIGIIRDKNKTRTFGREIRGLKLIFSYPENLTEFWWTILLLSARLYVWLLVFVDRKILKKEYSGNWERIESTK